MKWINPFERFLQEEVIILPKLDPSRLKGSIEDLKRCFDDISEMDYSISNVRLTEDVKVELTCTRVVSRWRAFFGL